MCVACIVKPKPQFHLRVAEWVTSLERTRVFGQDNRGMTSQKHLLRPWVSC